VIHYVALRDHLYTLSAILQVQPRLEGRLVPVAWEYLLQASDRPDGTWIFTDLDRLTPGQRRGARRVWKELSDAGRKMLNHPERALRRYELLRALRREGTNHFDVHRAWRPGASMRFPVFVRREDDHLGPVSPLLSTRAEVLAAVLAHTRKGTPALRHAPSQRRAPHRLIAVEQLDTADADGVYRKYGCFVVGKMILPRHLFFGREWTVKGPTLLDPHHLDEEREFLESHPHESALRRAVDRAGIEYGRIDYALHEGEVQIWEINTNPMVMHPDDRHGARAGVHAPFYKDFLGALDALEV
jgi:hypothetical protein